MKKILLFPMLVFLFFSCSQVFAAEIKVNCADASGEIERLISAIQKLPISRRIEFVSRYLLGRKYRPETRARINRQKKKVTKLEATNSQPLPVEYLKTGLTYLDCMTYVEHVLAIASCRKSDYRDEFLPRLVDIMFDANGKVLLNHYRNHFTSHWADINEGKGYLFNVARNSPESRIRRTILNKVGTNRTFYVADAFLKYVEQQPIHYFPMSVIISKKVELKSADIIAFVTDKEGLDVTHMAFYIKRNGKDWIRHASLKQNRVVDQDFYSYLKNQKKCLGLMVFRPAFKTETSPKYIFRY